MSYADIFERVVVGLSIIVRLLLVETPVLRAPQP